MSTHLVTQYTVNKGTATITLDGVAPAPGDAISFNGETRYVNSYSSGSSRYLNSPFTTAPTANTSNADWSSPAAGTVTVYQSSGFNYWIRIKGENSLSAGSTITYNGQTNSVVSINSSYFSDGLNVYEINAFSSAPTVGVSTVTTGAPPPPSNKVTKPAVAKETKPAVAKESKPAVAKATKPGGKAKVVKS